MKILISNDDGYKAEGFKALAMALSRRHDVYASAPLAERSGAGHGLTLAAELLWHKEPYQLFIEGYQGKAIPCRAVNGSPADAVKFAIEYLYKDEKFDLVVSGINSVLNVGTDIVYSGTFGAAEEGTILGIPSIALSTRAKRGGYELAAEFLADNLVALASCIQPHTTLNINVPSGIKENIKGVKVTPTGIRRYHDWYESTDSGFRLKGYVIDASESDEDTDCKWSDSGYITISAVKLVSNDDVVLNKLESKEWIL